MIYWVPALMLFAVVFTKLRHLEQRTWMLSDDVIRLERRLDGLRRRLTETAPEPAESPPQAPPPE